MFYTRFFWDIQYALTQHWIIEGLRLSAISKSIFWTYCKCRHQNNSVPKKHQMQMRKSHQRWRGIPVTLCAWQPLCVCLCGCTAVMIKGNWSVSATSVLLNPIFFRPQIHLLEFRSKDMRSVCRVSGSVAALWVTSYLLFSSCIGQAISSTAN